MSQTIAAIATAPGPSAIGIVRLSGPQAAGCVSALFRPADGRALTDHPPRTLVLGALHAADGSVLDQALATYSAAPHSYTGEDTAELQCHGSPAVLALALEALFAQGARQALPGEFTKRAFLNGRLDLTQAEAVADLIDAESAQAARQAALQLSGALSRRIAAIYDALTDLSAHFHAVLDYPDEDIDPFEAATLSSALSKAGQDLDRLLATYRRGRFLSTGIPCTIVGRPNAGKSSLLNALLGYDRAIVTDIPGTTRDTVEASCTLGGQLLRLIDTAGIRDTADPVERLGVERSRQALSGAALALVLWDGSLPPTQEDAQLLELARQEAEQVLLLRTKADLPPCPAWPVPDGTAAIPVSARTLSGLDELEAAVKQLFPEPAGQQAGELLTNQRQYDAALRARQAVERAQGALDSGFPPDAVVADVEAALLALGELTGANIRAEITERIFQRFCVGK